MWPLVTLALYVIHLQDDAIKILPKRSNKFLSNSNHKYLCTVHKKLFYPWFILIDLTNIVIKFYVSKMLQAYGI